MALALIGPPIINIYVADIDEFFGFLSPILDTNLDKFVVKNIRDLPQDFKYSEKASDKSFESATENIILAIYHYR